MPDKPVVDTSALIALEKINIVHVLCRLYGEIILPEAVVKEFGSLPIDCYLIEKVKSPLVKLLVNDLNLGKGEAEVIALASNMGAATIIDDLKARRIAENMGLKVTGTIGVLLKAERAGLVDSAYKKGKELLEKGFYVSDELLSSLSRFKGS
ncbi:MAG: DUF3368 domain-containing protein [Nitrospirae bacterium CG17_big_fil_post_rev_8_21_14_2_50_50_9]|nr:MAG: DUF3368 domain-containing protein [Nitrospirae bacterium CG17_big_fil_post_rev_8_21_14_2_50_50_9]PIW86064.1 MAG: DUF3368 domain-containing protein [Nitrospirae bacterium CG_4_8_14_3_um_filter_50_41]